LSEESINKIFTKAGPKSRFKRRYAEFLANIRKENDKAIAEEVRGK